MGVDKAAPANYVLDSCRPRQLPSCSFATTHFTDFTAHVKIVAGSLVTLENLFPPNYRYHYRLEIRMNSFYYHY